MPVKFDVADTKETEIDCDELAKKLENIYPSKVAFHLKRYDDIIKFIHTPKFDPTYCKIKEQELLLNGLKSSLQQRLYSHKKIKEAEQKLNLSEVNNEENQYLLVYVKKYKEKIRNEAIQICSEIYNITESICAAEDLDPICLVNCYKAKADSARYCSTISEGELKENFIEYAEESYNKGLDEARNKNISGASSCYLGLRLNYSVFLKEIREDFDKAFEIASQGFQNSIKEMYMIDDDNEYKETIAIISMLQNNIKTWAKEKGIPTKQILKMFGMDFDDMRLSDLES